MDLQERLMADMKQAMRDKDVLRRDVIRMARAAIKNAEIEKQAPLDDQEVIAVITKEVKKRRESIEMFAKGGRDDLVAQEEAEIGVLDDYLPEMMSEQEIEAVVGAIISEMGASAAAQFGPVMGKTMAKLRGQADGKLVNQVVKRLLGS